MFIRIFSIKALLLLLFTLNLSCRFAVTTVAPGKGMWQQFMNAKATCEAHGYTNVSLDILPGVGHQIHFDAELAFFYAHYLSTHPAH